MEKERLQILGTGLAVTGASASPVSNFHINLASPVS